ncbi:MAG: PQQ-dependent sugar dehydrogenase [Actinobacteria bacterium]|nr:PQQ-dependent sugar dehydrogenase [Actinomycetota bacterium]
MSKKVSLKLIADNFISPVNFAQSEDGSERLFIVDQTGLIIIITEKGNIISEPFLDITHKIVRLDKQYDERGLLGLCFHPDFKNNKRFFIYYSAKTRKESPEGYNCTNYVSEFTVSKNLNKADPDSERIIISIDKPQSNHNGGDIKFGPDGYLYIPVGDGGGANDSGFGHTKKTGNAQNISNLLGSILRIDINTGSPYTIPKDNPLVNEEKACPEIWAWGLRNPWRINFDSKGKKELFAGDVGQYLWEEVDIVKKGGNYGWNIMEGAHYFDPVNPYVSLSSNRDTSIGNEKLINPIIEYKNANTPGGGMGHAVIGGFMYRGNKIPELTDNYIFGDWSSPDYKSSGILLYAEPSYKDKIWPFDKIDILNMPGGNINEFLQSFGQDFENELYLLTSKKSGPSGKTGNLWKIIPS